MNVKIEVVKARLDDEENDEESDETDDEENDVEDDKDYNEKLMKISMTKKKSRSKKDIDIL